jgi:outer membrane protein OmpA-like peptidoglycan-associated protein
MPCRPGKVKCTFLYRTFIGKRPGRPAIDDTGAGNGCVATVTASVCGVGRANDREATGEHQGGSNYTHQHGRTLVLTERQLQMPSASSTDGVSNPFVTQLTFKPFGPSYPLPINAPKGVTARIKTMTSFFKISTTAAITLTAALSMTAGLAFAGDNNVSADQILHALQPKPLTRGLSIGPQADPTEKAREIHFVDTLRNRKTRSLSTGEREEIAEIASTKPNIDLDIQFDYNSAEISKTSMPAVQELGKALSNANLRGSTFVVAGHTDAIGSEGYNQDLSERRADTIKRYLTEKYGIAGTDLVTVGYGKSKPKDPNAPMDPVNRRVQVVNMDTNTASK